MQAEAFLLKLYEKETLGECLVTLIQEDPVLIWYLVDELPKMKEFLEHQHKPTLAALLAYKDILQISDKDWHHTVTLFELGEYAMLAHLKKLRSGYYNKKHQQQQTSLSKRHKLITDDLSLAEVQSPNNCHQYIIYIGGESKEEFERELKSIAPIITYLTKNKVKIDGCEFKLEPVLVCDLKVLVTLLGLYNCYHPKCYWKCPWCLASENTIYDFMVKEWPLQDETTMKRLAKEATEIPTEGGKETFARYNYGITGQSVLPFSLDHIIPYMLHCLMGVTRKLFELLVEEAYENEEIGKRYLTILEEINIKLIPEESSSKKKKK
ncbi:hypothetical protein QOT17_006359 [Balamuthia mandrillaris]